MQYLNLGAILFLAITGHFSLTVTAQRTVQANWNVPQTPRSGGQEAVYINDFGSDTDLTVSTVTNLTAVIRDESQAIVDVAIYQSKTWSWVWYIPVLLPSGKYHFEVQADATTKDGPGKIRFQSPDITVTQAFPACKTDDFQPKTLSNFRPVIFSGPKAGDSYSPGSSIGVYFQWIDGNHAFGKGVFKQNLELLFEDDSEHIPLSISNHDRDPTSSSENFAVPQSIPYGRYRLRTNYTLAETGQDAVISSYSDQFVISKDGLCPQGSSTAAGSKSAALGRVRTLGMRYLVAVLFVVAFIALV
ncbi:uncharacterized protein EV422DRAFT_524532 [Fimicolochytrium jonesii]|uniref:uncharacterized protein n=1 Tax=Fimicolochytrium jonesii TaxID=1396493 RepID=UPI0022FE4A9E|nr:uncharacterized protein EV422DRAFT_524532 [Fimicolochytrium jonesii]KAI8822575.1 hypothetical protein EV422DRAFT_524532 [Fimicolochytrium jonesii]